LTHHPYVEKRGRKTGSKKKKACHPRVPSWGEHKEEAGIKKSEWTGQGPTQQIGGKFSAK